MKPFWRCPWTWGVLLLALGLRACGLGWGLPWHAANDEYRMFRNVYYVATHAGRPLNQVNPPLQAYVWGAAMVPVGALGRCLGLLDDSGSLARTLGNAYVVHPDLYYGVGRGLSLIFGLGAVILLGRMAERRYGSAARIPAMLILAVNPFHVIASQGPNSTAMGLLTFLFALNACLDFPASPRPLRAIAWAGFLCGLAGATKQNGGFAIVVRVVKGGLRLPEKK